MAQGHGQGLSVRITSGACIESDVLTVCGKKKKKICIVQCCARLHICEHALVNPPLYRAHFLKPAVFLDQSSLCWKGREGGGREGIKDGGNI